MQTNLMVRLYSRTWVSTVFCRLADVKSQKRAVLSALILNKPRPVNWAEYSGSINIFLGITNPKSDFENPASLGSKRHETLASLPLFINARRCISVFFPLKHVLKRVARKLKKRNHDRAAGS